MAAVFASSRAQHIQTRPFKADFAMLHSMPSWLNRHALKTSSKRSRAGLLRHPPAVTVQAIDRLLGRLGLADDPRPLVLGDEDIACPSETNTGKHSERGRSRGHGEQLLSVEALGLDDVLPEVRSDRERRRLP